MTTCSQRLFVSLCIWSILYSRCLLYLLRTLFLCCLYSFFFFFSSRRRHTRLQGDWSSDVCSSDLYRERLEIVEAYERAGFYSYHVAEHHLTPLGMAPSPSVFLAAVAQRTKLLRLDRKSVV